MTSDLSIIKQAQQAQQAVYDLLDQYHIHDPFIVKVKRIKKRHVLALYRGGSQFLSKGITFWINERIELWQSHCRFFSMSLYDSLVETLLHEYGHVIAEAAEKRIPTLHNLIKQTWQNEEDFAEDFACFLTRPNYKSNQWRQKMNAVIQNYQSVVFEPVT